jgi:hypothetical protein
MSKVKLAQGIKVHRVIETAVFPINAVANKVHALLVVFVGRKRNDSLKFGGFHVDQIIFEDL